jgi:hypothetical protein
MLVHEVDVLEFEYAFGLYEDDIGGDVDVGGVVADGVETALQYAEQLDLFEQFLLLPAGFYLIDEFDVGVLIDCVYLV